tara:strand:- start:682 stop:978 length:297 start_codon:yes stop_codon:yes gene_type:complete
MNGKGDKWRGGWTTQYANNFNNIFRNNFRNNMRKINNDFLSNRYIALCISNEGRISDERIMSSSIDTEELALTVLKELQSSTREVWRLYKINNSELIY